MGLSNAEMAEVYGWQGATCEEAPKNIYLCLFGVPVGLHYPVTTRLPPSRSRASDLGLRPGFFFATKGGGANRYDSSSPTLQRGWVKPAAIAGV